MLRRFTFVRNEPVLAILLCAMVGCSGSPSDGPLEGSGGTGETGQAGGAAAVGGAMAGTSSDWPSAGSSGAAAGMPSHTEAGTAGHTSAQAGSAGVPIETGGVGGVALGTAGNVASAGQGLAGNSAAGGSTAGGGSVTGGTAAGGTAAGGTAAGGAATAGAGGKGSVGGSAGVAGKMVQGGAGTSNSGGASTGGASTGGASTGGASTGGASSGGASSGGTGGIAGASGTAGVAGGGSVSCPAGAKILCTQPSGAPPRDADCDGIADALEVGADAAHPLDTDGDGKPDYLDDDSDGDGLLDNVEVGTSCSVPRDSDGDKTPDYRERDADDNGILDALESSADTDGDGLADRIDLDDDADLLPDTLEIGANPAIPLDTDGDGTRDFKDTDADGDGIFDRDERASDGDGDGRPSYRDTDSDGDGIPDAIEAGDANPATPARDTDGDGVPDFIDTDSDGDGLLDANEDLDHDGVVDPGESSATRGDTDGDGVTDLVEVAAGTNPNDAADNPAIHGNFFFTEPFEELPSPSRGTFDFATKISRADIFFLMDTTGSMGTYIFNLSSSLSSTIIPTLASQISSIAIGVGSYRDFPVSSYGSSGDFPFRLDHRIMTVTTPAGIASIQARVNALSAGGGSDLNESSWEALHQVATGSGNSTGGSSVAAFNPATAYPTAPVAGESLGTLPGVGFRPGALPIVTYITDAPGHNTDTSTVSASDYATSSGIVSTRSTQAIAELRSIGAKVIGVSPGTTGTKSAARLDELAAVNATSTWVPPTAWGEGTSRPAACGVTQCCTGVSGAGEAPDASGNCALSFLVDSTGAGLGTAIVKAIQVLTTYGTINISARPVDDASDSVNAVSAFIDAIVANPTAGPPCDAGLTAADRDGDGRPETFVGVRPGARVCFDVLPKSNVAVPPTMVPQMFKAAIEVVGDGVTVLDTRNLFFLVPPTVQ